MLYVAQVSRESRCQISVRRVSKGDTLFATSPHCFPNVLNCEIPTTHTPRDECIRIVSQFTLHSSSRVSRYFDTIVGGRGDLNIEKFCERNDGVFEQLLFTGAGKELDIVVT